MRRIRNTVLSLVMAVMLLVGGLAFFAPQEASAHTYIYAIRCWSQQIQYATHYNGSYIHYLLPMRTMTAYEYWTYC